MATETSINGHPVTLAASADVDWTGWLAAVESYVREKGWHVHQITCDGAPVAVGTIPDLKSDSVLDVVAGPAEVDAEAFVGQLTEVLPQFRTALQGHADLFSKGSWKEALETLPALLSELSVVVEGLQLGLAALGRQDAAGLEAYSKLLDELTEYLEQQSWVEVSDLLLYELEPLLEEWASIAQRSE